MGATKNARDIFLNALDRAPADRVAYLDVACGGDAALRQRVEALLRAHDDPGAFLSEAQPGGGDADRGRVEAPLPASDVAPLPSAEAGEGTRTHPPDCLPEREAPGDPTARAGSV